VLLSTAEDAFRAARGPHSKTRVVSCETLSFYFHSKACHCHARSPRGGSQASLGRARSIRDPALSAICQICLALRSARTTFGPPRALTGDLGQLAVARGQLTGDRGQLAL